MQQKQFDRRWVHIEWNRQYWISMSTNRVQCKAPSFRSFLVWKYKHSHRSNSSVHITQRTTLSIIHRHGTWNWRGFRGVSRTGRDGGALRRIREYFSTKRKDLLWKVFTEKVWLQSNPRASPPPPVSGYGIHHSSEICNQTNLAMVWRFVNTKRFNDKNPKVLYLGSSSPTQDTQQADLFVELFSNNFSHSSIHQIFDQTSIKPERCQDLLLIEYYVFNELLKINTDKGTGPDGIHPLMLKHCAALM